MTDIRGENVEMKTRFPIVVLLTLSIILTACASPRAPQAPVEPAQAQVESTKPPSPVPTEAPTKAPAAGPVTLRVGAKCGPTPHALPLFVMLAQTGGKLDGVRIEYVPITESPQMAALLKNADVDVVMAQIINPVKMYLAGIPDLRLYSISMSKGVYVIAGKDVAGWKDLKGQRVLMPDPNSGPSFLGRASMRAAGFHPDTDFTIEYMPASQIQQLLIVGKAPAAVMEEPQVTIAISNAKKEGVVLQPAPIDLHTVFESKSWPTGQLPIDGMMLWVMIATCPGSTFFPPKVAFILAFALNMPKMFGPSNLMPCARA